MKAIISILTSTTFLLFSFSCLSAQTEMTARQYDNPQWQRIVYVDYQTQKRTMKDSAHWYARLVQNNALPREGGHP